MNTITDKMKAIIKPMSIKSFLCIIFVCSGAALLFGQEETGGAVYPAPGEEPPGTESTAALPEIPPDQTAESVPETDNSNTVYYIKDIEFDRSGYRIRTGVSRTFALLKQGDFKIGERITGKNKLEEYRLDKTQILINHRVLDRVNIDLTFEEPEADGSVPVILHVTTVDTATIIALPQPRFDDNEGFRIVLKARDYNFLGTMNPLRFDFGYEWDKTRRENSYFSLFDSDTPFRLFGFLWNFDFDNYFSYTPQAPFHYKNTSGLNMDLPVSFTTITFGLQETFVVNEDNLTTYPEDYPKLWVQQQEGGRYKEFYMSTTLSALWKIPTKIFVGKFGELNYSPQIEERFNYTPGGDIGYLRRGPITTLSHTLGFSRIDWLGNFRNGLAASINNTNAYNSSGKDWTNSLNVSFTGHIRLFSFFGASGKLQYRDWFHDTYTEAGDSLRGIRNDELQAVRMLSLSMDFPFRIFMFTPSDWFNMRALRFMNLEFHLAPIVDVALLVEPQKQKISPDNIRVTAGMEMVVFSHFWRNLYIRFSGGLNLRKLINTGSVADRSLWELFLGMEHHF
jgi:hypothetical protein